LIQALEEECLLSLEEEFERAISNAHAEDVSSWIEAIVHCITNNSSPIRLIDLQKDLKLQIVETWLGLLLGDFKLEQRGSFYDSSEIWIS
jgi:hypothetical protein